MTPSEDDEVMIQRRLQDLRYGIRSLLSDPLATLTVILSLGIGMGVTTTSFSILNAMALSDLPGVEDQDQLVTFAVSFEQGGERIQRSRFSLADLEVLRSHPELFSDIAAAGPVRAAIDVGSGAELVDAEVATPAYFRTLGARPVLGHFFSAGADELGSGPGTEAAAAGPAVAVLSYRFWENRFDRDPGVLGRTVRVNGHPLEVIGVAGEGFTGMTPEDVIDGAQVPLAVWIPSSMARAVQPSWAGADPAGLDARWFRPLARLRKGVSVDRLAAALPALSRELRELHPGERNGAEIEQGDLIFGPGTSSWRPTLTILGFMIVPLIVLLVACGNAAGILVARNAGRHRELAVRKALGASRGALVGQLLAESGILALSSGALGLLVALGARRIAGLFAFHLSMDIPLDWRVFTFALAASLLAGLFFGLIPALRATGDEVTSGFAGTARGASQSRRDSRLRNGLVVSQVALGLLLLVASGLFVRSAQHGLVVDSGLEEDHLLLLGLDLNLLDYDAIEGKAFQDRLLENLRTLPGVEEVAVADQPPFRGYPISRVARAGEDPTYGEPIATATVGARFPEAAGIAVKAGRSLIDTDSGEEAHVLVVNEAAARRLWPGSAPLGRRLQIRGESQAREVVGVVADTRSSLYDEPEPIVYLPRSEDYTPQTTLYIRTAGPPMAAADPVRAAVRRLDPRLPLSVLEPAEALRHRLLAPWRLGYLAMGGLGAIAVLLAGAGLYGILAHNVTRRRREIGVRVALGADTADVVRLVLLGALRLLVGGLAMGFLLAAGVASLLRRFLFGVSPLDPWVYAQVGALMLGITLVAALRPALRAASVQPVRAMEED